MVIAMLMVGSILGVVIHFTGTSMEMQSISMMRTIAASPFQQGAPGKPMDDEVRLPFFTVQISSRGELITTGGGYFDLTDREYLQQIVNLVLSADQKSGELKDYNLRYLVAMSPAGISIVFADTATETATIRSMVYSCMFIFAVPLGHQAGSKGLGSAAAVCGGCFPRTENAPCSHHGKRRTDAKRGNYGNR